MSLLVMHISNFGSAQIYTEYLVNFTMRLSISHMISEIMSGAVSICEKQQRILVKSTMEVVTMVEVLVKFTNFVAHCSSAILKNIFIGGSEKFNIFSKID